jgi:hypothetical protein
MQAVPPKDLTVHEQVETFMRALREYSHIVPCRSLRGLVNVMAHPGHTRLPSLLCVGNGCLSVVGGAELDQQIMCLPLQHVRVELLPGWDNMFHVTVLSHVGQGIFVEVTDRSSRDRWFAALSAIPGMTIDGWVCGPSVSLEEEHRNCLNGALHLVKWIS